MFGIHIRLNLEDKAGEIGLRRLNDTLGIPAGLAEIGLAESALDEAADGIAEVAVANPRAAGRDEIRAVLDDAYFARRGAQATTQA